MEILFIAIVCIYLVKKFSAFRRENGYGRIFKAAWMEKNKNPLQD